MPIFGIDTVTARGGVQRRHHHMHSAHYGARPTPTVHAEHQPSLDDDRHGLDDADTWLGSHEPLRSTRTIATARLGQRLEPVDCQRALREDVVDEHCLDSTLAAILSLVERHISGLLLDVRHLPLTLDQRDHSGQLLVEFLRVLPERQAIPSRADAHRQVSHQTPAEAARANVLKIDSATVTLAERYKEYLPDRLSSQTAKYALRTRREILSGATSRQMNRPLMRYRRSTAKQRSRCIRKLNLT